MPTALYETILPETKDLGGVTARRLLPSAERTMVGPFIFFDHLGPAVLAPGQGIDVRPHPHIHLATVTYLFEGALMHRDSLGTVQEIRPGAVNWMTAGRGIVHSERTPESDRQGGSRLHGIQTWVALPDGHEDIDPSFYHHPAADLPRWEEQGVSVTLIAGQACGRTSPVQVFSPMLYLDLQFAPGGRFTLTDDYGDRAIYSLSEGLTLDGTPLDPYRLVVLTSSHVVELAASAATRCIVIGGESVGDRHKWWNFVSSDPERIKQAKQDWQAGRFQSVPDETEFIPLPVHG